MRNVTRWCGMVLSLVVLAAGVASGEARADDAVVEHGQSVEAPQPATAGYSSETLSRDGFVAASEVRIGDQVPGGPLLLAAYLVFFALLLFYVVMLVRRQRGVAADLAALRGRIEQVEDRIEVARE